MSIRLRSSSGYAMLAALLVTVLAAVFALAVVGAVHATQDVATADAASWRATGARARAVCAALVEARWRPAVTSGAVGGGDAGRETWSADWGSWPPAASSPWLRRRVDVVAAHGAARRRDRLVMELRAEDVGHGHHVLRGCGVRGPVHRLRQWSVRRWLRQGQRARAVRRGSSRDHASRDAGRLCPRRRLRGRGGARRRWASSPTASRSTMRPRARTRMTAISTPGSARRRRGSPAPQPSSWLRLRVRQRTRRAPSRTARWILTPSVPPAPTNWPAGVACCCRRETRWRSRDPLRRRPGGLLDRRPRRRRRRAAGRHVGRVGRSARRPRPPGGQGRSPAARIAPRRESRDGGGSYGDDRPRMARATAAGRRAARPRRSRHVNKQDEGWWTAKVLYAVRTL